MLEEYTESEEVAESIAECSKSLVAAINGLKAAFESQKPPVVNVAAANVPAPQVNVAAPVIPPAPKMEPIKFPEPQKPSRWSFDVVRDKEGKIKTLIANPVTQ